MAIEIKTFTAKLADLIPDETNPRQISTKDFENLKKSLRDFPEMLSIRKVLIDPDMKIICGHQRVKALMELGETEVTVDQIFGLSEKKKKELLIKDNIQHGDWDWQKLDLFDEKDLLDWGFEGFFGNVEETYTPPSEPVTKSDDLYGFRFNVTKEQRETILNCIKGMDVPEELDGNTNKNGIAFYMMAKHYMGEDEDV